MQKRKAEATKIGGVDIQETLARVESLLAGAQKDKKEGNVFDATVGLINAQEELTKKLSDKAFKIYKKLVDVRLESLSGKLATGKQNPVGVIAILNHFYGWNSPYAPDANRHRTALSAAELPRLNEVKTVEIAQDADRLTDSGNE